MVTQEKFSTTIEIMKPKTTLFSSKKHHISSILLSIEQIHIILEEIIFFYCVVLQLLDRKLISLSITAKKLLL